MWASIRLRSIDSVEALMARRRRPRMRPASASAMYQSQISATVSRSADLASCGDWVDAFGHGDELLVGDGARLLDSHQSIAPDDDPPGSAIGGAILDDEALEARRHDLHAEASQLAIPEKMLPNLDPNLGRFRRFHGVDDAFCELFASHISDLLEVLLRIESIIALHDANSKHLEASRRVGLGYGRRI